MVEVDTVLLRAALTGIRRGSGDDGERFAQLLRFHRLSGRALEVYGDLRDALSAAQWGQLAMIREEELDRIDTMISGMAALSAQLPSVPPFVQIKGTSAYEHLGRRQSRARPSNDLDVIGADPDLFPRLGYRLSKGGICHESGSFIHDTLPYLDLHRYSPSWSISDGLIRSRRIGLESILEHSVGSRYWSGDVRIPDVTMAAMIICSHAYRTYVEHPALREAPVKLAEIFEFEELCRHPSFDRELFDELTRRFAASEAVRFVTGVLVTLRPGQKTMATSLEVARGVLSAVRFGAAELFDPSRIFAQVSAVPHVALSARTGATTRADPDHAPETGSWNRTGNLSELPRISMSLSRLDANEVCLKVRADVVSGDYKDELRVTMASGSVGVQRDVATGQTAERRSGIHSWNYSVGAAQQELRLDLRVALPAGAQVSAVISSHSFPEAVNDDWNAFYDVALASGCVVALLNG